MTKFFHSIIAFFAIAAITTACDDNSDSEPTVDPANNYWTFNNGQPTAAGSVLICQSSGMVNILVSSKAGLTSVVDFYDAPDYTEITLPASEVGKQIDLANLADNGQNVVVHSNLKGFGSNYGITIDNACRTISQGSLSTSLSNGEMTVDCQFTTIAQPTLFKLHLCAPLTAGNPDADTNSLTYKVGSLDIDVATSFASCYYLKDTWNQGWTFTYSVANTRSYVQIGNNTCVEIHVDSDRLLNGKPFDIATTSEPFSLKFEYLVNEFDRPMVVEINNTNRAGASGTITLTKNNRGLYDVQFDVSLSSGDIALSGSYNGLLQPRNAIYSGTTGNAGVIRSATLNISSNPCVLYLSASAQAGPDNFDIKCEVPKNEWLFDIYMAFSGQGSSIRWIDGNVYNKTTTDTSSYFGGNWRVKTPVEVAPGKYVAECQATLFGSKTSYAYYYGEINLIK